MTVPSDTNPRNRLTETGVTFELFAAGCRGPRRCHDRTRRFASAVASAPKRKRSNSVLNPTKPSLRSGFRGLH